MVLIVKQILLVITIVMVKKEKKAVMHFQQVQRFIFAKKIFWVKVHFKGLIGWFKTTGSCRSHAPSLSLFFDFLLLLCFQDS